MTIPEGIDPIDGHFDCFSVWAKMDTAVMNILVHVIFYTHTHTYAFLLSVLLGVELLVHGVCVYLA